MNSHSKIISVISILQMKSLTTQSLDNFTRVLHLLAADLTFLS